MKSLNPTAVMFWAIGSGTGYLITDTPRGALVGLVVSLSLSFVASVISGVLHRG